MKSSRQSEKLQTAAEYLTEYSGVKAAVITDHEGLLVAASPQVGVDSELYAAAGVDLITNMDRHLRKIIDPGCEYISVKTGKHWLTIAQASRFYLIVIAERKADDLLTVRISRSLEMISAHLKDKYPALLFLSEPGTRKSNKNLEASHV